ncbi:host specificity protein J [Brucella pseudogrignonensis]|uniref:host specificity protein J n=1 Tax=Brucella pseudogrignonensis TaxID=419475 RepID=UPI003D958E3C
MTKKTIPVLAAPVIDPGAQRIELELPFGLTISDIVRATLPGLTLEQYAHVRVALVNDQGSEIVTNEYWHRIKPRAHVRVVIRIVPGKGALRSVLQIVVSIAAIALGQLWAPMIAGSAFGMGLSATAWQGIIGLGVGLIGNLLINALIPVQSADKDKEKPTYAISGWRNNANPDGHVPMVLGKHRMAPPFAAMTYTEIVDDIQYIRSLFCFGYGPLTITDTKIGDTATSKYKDIEIQLREGLPTDTPVDLYPSQVLEEQVGAELRRDLPRNEYGDVIEGDSVISPETRFSASDASEACVILSFPAGLVSINSDGDPKPIQNTIRIRQRRVGVTAWTIVTTLRIRVAKLEGFYRSHRWKFPTRGRYEIEVTRMNDERDDPRKTDRTVWVVLQSFRPEYPLNFDQPLALAAVRVRATYQLNGALDNFNALVQRRCLDYDRTTGTWIERLTRNPASLYRYALQGPGNANPARDSEIDLEQLADWHNFCRIKGLKYDRIHDFEASLYETLAVIAAAGRASPRHDGVKWGVVIDRPQTLAVDHINPRNSWDFSWSRTYVEPPHAMRVQFLDETNDYQQGERIVPWPGHTGDITVTEQFDIPGKTDPAEIWRETRRRQYEIMHRPDSYTVIQDGPTRVATRGDLVMVSHDVISQVQHAARVIAVRGELILLDEEAEMIADTSYGIRFRRITEANTVGISIVRTLRTIPGLSSSFILTGSGFKPVVGDIVHFGPVEQESFPMIVNYTEAGEEMSTVLSLLDASPIIDELTDAEIAPAWDGRVGAEIISGTQVPSVPIINSVVSGFKGTENVNGLQIIVTVGRGSTAVVEYFNLYHRIAGSGSWSTITAPAADGSFDVEGYVAGDTVEFSIEAVSIKGFTSIRTNIMSATVGSEDAAIPHALPSESVSASGGIGAVSLTFATSADSAIAFVQVYRTPAGTALDRNIHKLGNVMPVVPRSSYTRIDGDATRINLARTSSASDWIVGEGWASTGATASKSSGIASDISQIGFDFGPGKTYRLRFDISGQTEGSIRPKLERAGFAVNGPVFSSNGPKSIELVAALNLNMLTFSASEQFNGVISNIVIYEVTANQLPSGSYDYYLEPLNIDLFSGPVIGPFTATVS